MSDENLDGEQSAPVVPVAAPPVASPAGSSNGGAFEWLQESHRHSAPLAPLTDDIPSPIRASGYMDAPPSPAVAPVAPVAPAAPAAPSAPPSNPAEQMPLMAAPPPLATPVVDPGAAPLPPRPGFMAGSAASAPTAATGFPFPDLGPAQDDTSAQPFLAPGVGGTVGVGPLGLERREPTRRSGNGPLDWAAFVLAFVLPPIGLVVGIVALILDSRAKRFAPGVAKAAVAIAVVLSIALGVGAVVLIKLQTDQAQQDAIAASSVAWCSKLTANAATLSSATYGWPAPANTIPQSITSMQTYAKFWQSAVAIAPSGIKTGTRLIVSNAKTIIRTVKSTQTLDDAADVSQMQSAVASSGIQSWVSHYCH